MATSDLYRRMAEIELHGISPSYEAVCLAVADDPGVCSLLDTLPGNKRQPNLLLGAVRYLDGPVADAAALLAFVQERWDDMRAVILSRATQTNEAGRCAVLLPLLAGLPQPLALLEVGASAGLCLYPDRYAYRYGDHRLGSSAVDLACTVAGPVPLPSTMPEVVWRGGLDLNPLRADEPDDRRWLASLIWPEQTERASRLDAACAVVAADPPVLRQGDALTDLPNLVDEAPTEATLVLFHSAVLAYLDQDGRDRFEQVVHEVRRRRPLHWLTNEAPGVVRGTRGLVAPGRFVLTHDGRPVALAGPHGQSLEWLA